MGPSPCTFRNSFFSVLLFLQHVLFAQAAINLDLGNTQSIKDVSRQLADSTMKYYIGNQTGQTPGLLLAAGQFQWWIGGALFGQMIEYWYYTGDSTYNDVVTQALLFQTGPNYNYEPENQTRTEGNDDQAFWAFAAMSAAEMNFPNPPPTQPQWLALAQAVFNRQAGRWDSKNCGGGLRWQFNVFNAGYDMKNSISNGCFFQLAARLARYTQNSTYSEWANKMYDWMAASPLIEKSNYAVYDSIHFDQAAGKCPTDVGKIEWTYNIGNMLAGAAYMYNITKSDVWQTRINGYLAHIQQVFFPQQWGGGKVMVEYACEPLANCNADQRSFKAYLSRWLAVTVQMAPFTTNTIMPWLQQTATAVAKICDGTGKDIACGRKWYVDKNDGTIDVGNQMAAMSIVQSNLIMKVESPANIDTGSSKGDASSGYEKAPAPPPKIATRPMTGGDRAGGWILTILVLGATGVLAYFMFSEGEGMEWRASSAIGNRYTGQWGR